MSGSPEVIDMADSPPARVDLATERAEAFSRLADSHLDASYRLARAILHNPTEAEDAVHDAFVQACATQAERISDVWRRC